MNDTSRPEAARAHGERSVAPGRDEPMSSASNARGRDEDQRHAELRARLAHETARGRAVLEALVAHRERTGNTGITVPGVREAVEAIKDAAVAAALIAGLDDEATDAAADAAVNAVLDPIVSHLDRQAEADPDPDEEERLAADIERRTREYARSLKEWWAADPSAYACAARRQAEVLRVMEAAKAARATRNAAAR